MSAFGIAGHILLAFYPVWIGLTVIFDMEDAHHGDLPNHASVDEGLLPGDVFGHTDIRPIRAVTEGFLCIDDQEGSIGH